MIAERPVRPHAIAVARFAAVFVGFVVLAWLCGLGAYVAASGRPAFFMVYAMFAASGAVLALGQWSVARWSASR